MFYLTIVLPLNPAHERWRWRLSVYKRRRFRADVWGQGWSSETIV